MLKDMQERHIVHHDLKPANCLVSTQGDMKVRTCLTTEQWGNRL
jgi:serine/threonine protein kinase